MLTPFTSTIVFYIDSSEFLISHPNAGQKLFFSIHLRASDHLLFSTISALSRMLLLASSMHAMRPPAILANHWLHVHPPYLRAKSQREVKLVPQWVRYNFQKTRRKLQLLSMGHGVRVIKHKQFSSCNSTKLP